MYEVFENALGLVTPWYITDLQFDAEKRRLDIHIDFHRGSTFFFESKEDDVRGEFKAYDTVIKKWRHLNFFQHECFLHCRVPRVSPRKGIVRRIKVPWEGVNSGFTLLFEALLLQLCSQMPVNAVSRLVGEDDEKIWRVLEKYIDRTRDLENFSEISAVGIDETSRAKRHNYVTTVVDLESRRTIFVTEGKDHTTIERFKDDFESHKGDTDKIIDVCCDMSPAFKKGISDNLKNAEITFDKFHVMKIINEAVDEVRKQEAKENPLLKRTKYIFLKNRENLTPKQEELLSGTLELKSLRLKSTRALHLRESFQDIYHAEDRQEFIDLLKKWYSWARRCRLEPMKSAAKTIKEHWDGIINWFDSGISNGILEGINSLIQAAKRRARGYRSNKNFCIIIYLITGKLDFTKLNPEYLPL